MALQGPIPVPFQAVFPHGAFGLSVEPTGDFTASTKDNRVQARDKDTGFPLWTLTVMDADPQARDKTLKVKVSGPVQPVLPDPIPGTPLHPVELDGLSITPYVTDKGRVAYSYRATGIRSAGAGSGQRPVTAETAA